jgi:hypothetical protein
MALLVRHVTVTVAVKAIDRDSGPAGRKLSCLAPAPATADSIHRILPSPRVRVKSGLGARCGGLVGGWACLAPSSPSRWPGRSFSSPSFFLLSVACGLLNSKLLPSSRRCRQATWQALASAASMPCLACSEARHRRQKLAWRSPTRGHRRPPVHARRHALRRPCPCAVSRAGTGSSRAETTPSHGKENDRSEWPHEHTVERQDRTIGRS